LGDEIRRVKIKEVFMLTPYISMAGIGKSFGPVHALKSVDLTIYPHEIHALLGENGAGKSTLMKVLSGIHEPTKGTITINNVNYDKLDHKLAASSASALFIRSSASLMN
jgi:D-allose transport system ATP-binding protein